MSTISAGTTTGTALVSTGDTSGNLELQSSGVTKLTVGSGGVTLASALPVASGGTGAATLTANNVLLGNGTSAVQVVAPGTNGNVLTSNGTTWASTAPVTGAMVFLSSVTASSSATVDLETGIDSTYDYYMITFAGIVPATDNVVFRARLKINGTYQTSTYSATTIYASSDSSSINVDRPTDSFNIVRYNVGNSSGMQSQGFFMFGVPTSTSLYKAATWNATGFCPTSFGSNVTNSDFGGGFYAGGTQALSGVRFYFSSGNIASGTFRLYGIKNS